MHDVLDVLVAEVLERAEHGIGGRLAKPAQTRLLHRRTEILKQRKVIHGSSSIADARVVPDRSAPTCDYYRVTIKKVPPPAGQTRTPPALVSTFFHEQVNEGDILDVKVPSGRFYLDMTGRTPVVLIGGGVGITPVLSMLNAVAQSGSRREAWFFLGVRNSGEHIQKAHLEEIAAQNPNIRLHICYSDPGPDDKDGRDYHHAERVSLKLLKQLLPSNAYDFYICGPPPMMSSLTQGLKEWGVPDDYVHFEAFGPATVKAVAPAVAPTAVATTAQTFQINFARSGKVLPWDQKMQSLLDFASGHGVTIDSWLPTRRLRHLQGCGPRWEILVPESARLLLRSRFLPDLLRRSIHRSHARRVTAAWLVLHSKLCRDFKNPWHVREPYRQARKLPTQTPRLGSIWRNCDRSWADAQPDF